MTTRVNRLRYCTWQSRVFANAGPRNPKHVYFAALWKQEAEQLLTSLAAGEVAQVIAGVYGPYDRYSDRYFQAVDQDLRRQAIGLLRCASPGVAAPGGDPYTLWRRALLETIAPFVAALHPQSRYSQRKIVRLGQRIAEELSLDDAGRVEPAADRYAELLRDVEDMLWLYWNESLDVRVRMLAGRG